MDVKNEVRDLRASLEKEAGRTLSRAERQFLDSLGEGLKHAAGKKAKVKVEELVVRAAPKDLADFRKRLGITQPKAAMLLGVSYETWKKWETGRVRVPGPASHWIISAKRRPKVVAELLKELLPAA